MPARCLTVVALLLASVPAQAASLRPMTILHGPTVFLRDLFDDAGSNANRPLGSGPGPGGRIVVEAAQLNAIARQFGVDWHAVSHGDRAVLEWPGRKLNREAALDALRAALVLAGASDDCEIEIPGFTPPIVPADVRPKPVVSQLDYDEASGRFTATLSVTGDGMEPINTRIGGHVDETIALPVLTARLPAGTVLRPEDVRMARVHTSQVHGEVAHALAQVVGMQLRRQVVAGQPLPLGDVTPPALVQRGTVVQMQLRLGGLTITGQGMALEPGAAGDRIHVQNTGSHAVLVAEVIGPGMVRISPSTVIAPAATGRTLVP
ncbi:MAG TPA: flagellar basal body P-ring formation chaperone FlgA [Acetobacteraceae bacterium]|nr:flagellar basal body P-ring formation chaperone FlgA [Acetobacteraceae bacterium]